jgi:hypothetical protein
MQDGEKEDGDDGYDSEDEEESESDEEEEELIVGPRLGEGTVNELRQLLEECWKMAEQREELNLLQVSWQ